MNFLTKKTTKTTIFFHSHKQTFSNFLIRIACEFLHSVHSRGSKDAHSMESKQTLVECSSSSFRFVLM